MFINYVVLPLNRGMEIDRRSTSQHKVSHLITHMDLHMAENKKLVPNNSQPQVKIHIHYSQQKCV